MGRKEVGVLLGIGLKVCLGMGVFRGGFLGSNASTLLIKASKCIKVCPLARHEE